MQPSSRPRFDLIPTAGLRAVAETYKEGSLRYGPFNWERGMEVHDLLNHAIRHLQLWIGGDRSEDHIGHAAWGYMAAIHSYILWPHLNDGKLRSEGCKPPRKAVTA